MPNVPKTQHRSVRVPDPRWERFGELTGNRAEVLNAFMAWFNREPGAKLPKRPDPVDAPVEAVDK